MGLTGIDGKCNGRVSMQSIGRVALKYQRSNFQLANLISQWLPNQDDYAIVIIPVGVLMCVYHQECRITLALV